MTDKLKQLLISAGISLAFISLIGGGLQIFDNNDLYMVKFDGIEIQNGEWKVSQVYEIIDGWIRNDPDPKGKYRKDYEVLYDLYKSKNIDVEIDNGGIIASIEDTELMIAAFNAKLMEIRENCKEDSRCVVCEKKNKKSETCKIKNK